MRSLFGLDSGLQLSTSVPLCFDGRDDDDSVLDSEGWGSAAVADGEEGGRNSEFWLGSINVDKLSEGIKALPAFCCSSKIFCKYLACSSMRN